MAGVLLAAAALIAAYWIAWLAHRSLVASETGARTPNSRTPSRWPTAGWRCAWSPPRTAS